MIQRENTAKSSGRESKIAVKSKPLVEKRSTPSEHSNSTSSGMKMNARRIARRIPSPNQDTTSSTRVREDNSYNAMRAEKRIRRPISSGSENRDYDNKPERQPMHTRIATPIESKSSEGAYLKEALQRKIDRRSGNR